MIYAIPSYKRAERQETLEYLLGEGVSHEQIYIFVQTADDYRQYTERYKDLCHILLREADSVTKARNNILNHFDGRDNVLMLDDDVSGFYVGAKGETLRKMERFEAAAEKMFDITAALRGQLFGLYPVYNDFFMSNDISTKVTVNTVLGIPKGIKYRFDEEFIAKEDIELCGRLLHYGKSVIRFNNVTFKAKHRTNAGGAHDTWASGVNKDYSKRLEVMYPDIFKVKRTNTQEVRLCIKDEKKRGISWDEYTVV